MQMQKVGRGRTFKTHCVALASVAHLIGSSSHKPQDCRFDSQSLHVPRFRVQSLVGVHRRGN